MGLDIGMGIIPGWDEGPSDTSEEDPFIGPEPALPGPIGVPGPLPWVEPCGLPELGPVLRPAEVGGIPGPIPIEPIM
jgi:hypothetical protein